MVRPIIAVLGATGRQGNAIVQACLKSGEWSVRALTRNVNSTSAQTLSSEGAEVVAADLDDVESLVQAFKDVQAIFAITNFFEHLGRTLDIPFSAAKEVEQAKNVALAASRTPSLQHYLFSTLQDTSSISNGRRSVPHMDSKASVDAWIRSELPDLAAKSTFLWIAWYGSNIIYYPMYRPIELPMSGGTKYIWAQPSPAGAYLPVAGDVDINLGVFTLAALKHPEVTHGKYLSVRQGTYKLEEIARVWGEVAGKECVYVVVSRESYVKMWGVLGEEMALCYEFGEENEDWEAEKRDLGELVAPREIGIEEKQLVGLKEYLEGVKEEMLAA